MPPHDNVRLVYVTLVLALFAACFQFACIGHLNHDAITAGELDDSRRIYLAGDDSNLGDSDGDGVDDEDDDFPNDVNETTDTDGDGTGDNADNDDDNDGVPNPGRVPRPPPLGRCSSSGPWARFPC